MRFDKLTVQRLYSVSALYATSDQTAHAVLARASTLLTAEEMMIVSWALLGQATGHEWCACSKCGTLRLMDPPTPSKGKERCKMTYDCDGEMERIAPRARLTPRVKRNLHECPYCGRIMSGREAAEQGACNDCYDSGSAWSQSPPAI